MFTEITLDNLLSSQDSKYHKETKQILENYTKRILNTHIKHLNKINKLFFETICEKYNIDQKELNDVWEYFILNLSKTDSNFSAIRNTERVVPSVETDTLLKSSEDIKQNIKKDIKQNIKKDIKQNINKEVKQNIKKEICSDFSNVNNKISNKCNYVGTRGIKKGIRCTKNISKSMMYTCCIHKRYEEKYKILSEKKIIDVTEDINTQRNNQSKITEDKVISEKKCKIIKNISLRSFKPLNNDLPLLLNTYNNIVTDDKFNIIGIIKDLDFIIKISFPSFSNKDKYIKWLIKYIHPLDKVDDKIIIKKYEHIKYNINFYNNIELKNYFIDIYEKKISNIELLKVSQSSESKSINNKTSTSLKEKSDVETLVSPKTKCDLDLSSVVDIKDKDKTDTKTMSVKGGEIHTHNISEDKIEELSGNLNDIYGLDNDLSELTNLTTDELSSGNSDEEDNIIQLNNILSGIVKN